MIFWSKYYINKLGFETDLAYLPNMVEIEKSRQKTESFRFEIESISIRADSGWNQ
jgi:hypothetical protein